MKFVDMSQTPPVMAEAFTFEQIKLKVAANNIGFNHSLFKSLPERDDICLCPIPDYEFDGVPYWLPSAIEKWKSFYEKVLEIEDSEKAKRLATETVSLNHVVEKLIEAAEIVNRRNARAGSYNRGNSLKDGRLRVVELMGAYDFVFDLLKCSEVKMSESQIKRYNDALSHAKSAVNMQ